MTTGDHRTATDARRMLIGYGISEQDADEIVTAILDAETDDIVANLYDTDGLLDPNTLMRAVRDWCNGHRIAQRRKG